MDILRLAHVLLNDANGITEEAYQILQQGLIEAHQNGICAFVKATDGRFYLPEGFEYVPDPDWRSLRQLILDCVVDELVNGRKNWTETIDPDLLGDYGGLVQRVPEEDDYSFDFPIYCFQLPTGDKLRSDLGETGDLESFEAFLQKILEHFSDAKLYHLLIKVI